MSPKKEKRTKATTAAASAKEKQAKKMKRIKKLRASKISKVSKDTLKILKKRRVFIPKRIKGSERGCVYLSHVPHGFYENELKQFFSQFGKVTAVKVPRSTRTGKYKGYAFIEFMFPDVAKIAAETMNNYLMFKKVVKAKYLPPKEQKQYAFKFP